MSKKSILLVLSVIVIIVILYLVFSSDTMVDGLAKELKIVYPYDKTLFPPEIATPTFRWDDTISGADFWHVRIEFEDSKPAIRGHADTTEWTPERETWEIVKNRSLEKAATVTICGKKKSLLRRILSLNRTLSKNSITISTSADSVEAPIFYRDVPLPFDFAREKMELIQWRLGDISKSERPPVVLTNLPVCGNCHSFTPDGSTLAMDVDSAGDKGSYVITPIEEKIFLTREKLITWSDYKREEGEATFGLLAQISPCGRYVACAVKDRVIFIVRTNLLFSQLFFPVKGIIAIYDRKTKKITSLQGADDYNYVQGNPSWSPDGKYIIFARTPITDYIKNDKTKNVVLTRRQSAVVLGGDEFLENSAGGETYKFNLYRIPFNDGEGGTPEPIPGASHNGKSNYFAKYSPDGKWIVFCQARSFMLLQPDSKLYIMPADLSEEPRPLKYNTSRLNSWHSWSPNSRWLVFSSKERYAYTDLYLKHIDEEGNDSPPVLLSSFSSNERARNIPEFVNIKQGGIEQIYESFVDYYSYTRKGYKMLSYGKNEEAEKSFRKSIELNPNFAEAHCQLGYILNEMNRIDEAEKELEIALKLDPKDPVANELLGRIYRNRKEYDKAQNAMETSLKFDPNYAPAHVGLGVILLLKGNTKRAEKKFETALQYDPDNADAHYRLGTIYMKRKEFDKAEKAFEIVLKIKYDSDTYNRLGTIHMFKKEYDKAKKEYENALKIDPNNSGALHNLGILYMMNKEYAKAEKAFRTVYRTYPNNPEVCFMLGKVLSMNNRTIPEAISMYNKALTLMPSNIQGHIDLGNLYLKVGDKARAINEFEKALQLNPGATSLKEQIEHLKRDG